MRIGSKEYLSAIHPIRKVERIVPMPAPVPLMSADRGDRAARIQVGGQRQRHGGPGGVGESRDGEERDDHVEGGRDDGGDSSVMPMPQIRMTNLRAFNTGQPRLIR